MTSFRAFNLPVLISFLMLVLLSAPASVSSVAFPPEAEMAVGDEGSAAALSIEIVAPSYASGDDFASVEVGNPWDMDSTDDIDAYWTADPPSSGTGPPVNTTYSVSNGILNIVSNDNGRACTYPNDEVPHRPLALNLGGKRIDTYKYRYFVYRYRLEHNLVNYACGNVSRIRWFQDSPVWAQGRTDDVLIPDNQWKVHELDLWTNHEPIGGGAPYQGVAQWNVLQIMLHEANYGLPSQLDWAMLTADNTVQDSYKVMWNVSNGVTSSSTPTTTIYWATERNASSVLEPGYVVTSGAGISPTLPYTNNVFLPMMAKNHSDVPSLLDAEYEYTVGVDGLLSGTYYYIAIKIEDGATTTWAFSEVPVKKISG